MIEQGSFAPILRSRLIERLAACARYPVALIIAPVGYGKSVVLRQYLSEVRTPAVRFALRSEHATLLSFLRGFAEALREVAPYAITTLAGAYERNQSSTKRGADLARWMHAHVETFSGVVAIDDLHLADGDGEVARFLTSLIERSKERISWIVASRSSTHLPVGTWLAYRDADLPVDEHDLRFTLEEARLAARDFGLSIRDDELTELLELTEGWPAAMSFALRTSTRSADLRNISAVTREMIYRFLAEQVYDGLDEDERGLLEVAMALPMIDVDVLERAGFDRALQIVERLRERTAFIYEESPRIYQCHDLFREFLRHEGALGGKRSQQAVQERAARGLEASQDIEHAIAAYAAAGTQADVLRLLERYGFDLLERARSDVVAHAIEALDEKTRRENATVLALNGALQATLGKFARAESLFRRSLARAGDNRDLVATTSLRLATLIGNQGRDAADILDVLASDESCDPAYRAEAFALSAASRAISGNVTGVEFAVRSATALLEEVEDNAMRAKVLHHLGIVNRHTGSVARAFDSLRQSSDLALELHLYGLASRVYAVLSNLALHEQDDVESQLQYAEAAAEAAAKAGDAFALQTALLQKLSARMRRGDVEMSIALEEAVANVGMDETTGTYLTLFKSVRLAWQGRFGEAQRLASSWKEAHFDFDRVSCGSQYALFLALDDQRGESMEVIGAVLPLACSLRSKNLFAARTAAISQVYCAVAESVNGRATRCERILQRLDVGDAVTEVAKRVGHGIAQMLANARASRNISVPSEIERLENLGYSDAANVLRATYHHLASRLRNVSDVGNLTRSEIDILRLLADGKVAKEIAAETSRSVRTVRAHIANAVEKLDCRGQSQAISVARRRGLI